MKVCWICDDPGYLGGAELTMQEFRAAAPPDVSTDASPEDADVVVLGNVASCLDAEAIGWLERRPVVKYVHDMWPDGDRELRDWLIQRARLIFTSPLHAKRFGPLVAEQIPPAIPLKKFRPPRPIRRHADRRQGAVSIASWRGPGKGAQLVMEYAAENGGVAVYGPGPFLPVGPDIDYGGELPPDQVAPALWRHETFVFLPSVIEPFGRSIVEAWAAGCRIVANGLVGATYWIAEDPQALETAATDFWRVVCESA